MSTTAVTPKGHELVNGRLVERSASVQTHHVAGQVMAALMAHAERRTSLWVATGHPFRCFHAPTQIRRPSVAAIRDERLPREDDCFPCPIAPDFVAEVISKQQTADDVECRLTEWLDAGVKVVWVVNPTTRSVRVHSPSGYRFLRAGDTLTAPEVLPGFAVPVAELFRRPGEPVAPAAAPVT